MTVDKKESNCKWLKRSSIEVQGQYSKVYIKYGTDVNFKID